MVVLVYTIPYLVQMLPMLAAVAELDMVAKANHPVRVVLVAVAQGVQMLEEQLVL
jgi:hypothetical protein